MKPDEVSLGTTIITAMYDGGIMMAADSRTSIGTFISNRITNKISTLVPGRIFCCTSGSAADTAFIAKVVSINAKHHEMENHKPITVRAAANICRKISYNNKGQLYAGLIIAGWDPVDGYSIYSVDLGGDLHKKTLAISGSGSGYIYGYCDAHYNSTMTKDQCQKFLSNAVSLAMARDGYSGGVIRTLTLDSNGVERNVIKIPDTLRHLA